MKKVLEKPVKMSKERQIQDPQLEQVTAQKSTNAFVEEFSLVNEKKGEVTGFSEEQKQYFRMSLFSIDPEQKEEFIKQSDTLKNKVQERLGGGILSAYMVEVERDKLLLVGIYDSVANAVKGKLIADDVFLEMDSKFIVAPMRIEEGPVVYTVDY